MNSIRWSEGCIYFQIDKSSNLSTNAKMNIYVCILSSNSKSIKIDNEEKECYLNLIGYTLSDLPVVKNSSIEGKSRQINEEYQSKESKYSRIKIDDVDESV